MDAKVKPVGNDPLNVNGRLYKEISELLDDVAEDGSLTVRERIAAIVAIARIQIAFVALRKESKNDPNSGSAVRKYAGAFAKNAASRGKKGARPTLVTTEAADPFEPDGFDDDGGDAA